MLPASTIAKLFRDTLGEVPRDRSGDGACDGASTLIGGEDLFGDGGDGVGPHLLATHARQCSWLGSLSEWLAGPAWSGTAVDGDRVAARSYVVRRELPREIGVELTVSSVPASGQKKIWDTFRMRFESRDGQFRLWIQPRRRRGSTSVQVGQVWNALQLRALIVAVAARQDRAVFLEQRTEKLVDLQRRGMAGQLMELSEKRQLAYCIQKTGSEVRLSLRLAGRKRGYHMSFAKGRMAAVMAELPGIVDHLERMAGLGVQFRTHNDGWSRGVQWTEPAPPHLDAASEDTHAIDQD